MKLLTILFDCLAFHQVHSISSPRGSDICRWIHCLLPRYFGQSNFSENIAAPGILLIKVDGPRLRQIDVDAKHGFECGTSIWSNLFYKVPMTPIYNPTKFIDERSRYVYATAKSIQYKALPSSLASRVFIIGGLASPPPCEDERVLKFSNCCWCNYKGPLDPARSSLIRCQSEAAKKR
jgi:hypothetical protein